MSLEHILGSERELRDLDPSQNLALGDCVKALERAAVRGEDGAMPILALLTQAPALMTHNELGLFIALVQRIGMRRRWMVGNDSNKERL